MQAHPRLLTALLFAFVASPALRGAEVKTLNTPRAFPEIKTAAQWQEHAQAIREQALVSCGLWPLPERTPLRAQVSGKIVRDGYSVERVHLQTYPGFYLAGNLYRPVGKGDGPFPGVLNPHGHWKEGRLVDNADGSVAARCINFARQGMVAFAYDMIGYNDTFFPEHAELDAARRHRMIATNKTSLLWNINLMGLQTWNSIRALDFLESLPDVDPKRLACTGASGGGTQTFMLGAIDPRLAAVAPMVMVSHSMQGGCLCENAPGLRVDFSNMEIAAAAAPRPQILVAATGDWTKATATLEGPAIAGVYRLLDAGDRFHHVTFDFGHNYNRTTREAVYAWFDHWLLGAPLKESVAELDYRKESDEALRVWPDNRLPADAVSEAELIAFLVKQRQEQLQKLRPTDKASLVRFKHVMLPAWRHTLQVTWPRQLLQKRTLMAGIAQGFAVMELAITRPETGDTFHAVRFEPATKTSANGGRPITVVLAHPDGGAGYVSGDGGPVGLARKLAEKGWSVLVLKSDPAGETPNQFANFFTTYNRTAMQQRVADLISACGQADDMKSPRVVLCGEGRAGLWALLAAPAADAVIADADGLDVANNDVLLAPDLFCPGIRGIGGFAGAAMLAAPNPVLIHNTGRNFATESLEQVYRLLDAQRAFHAERRKLSDEAIVRWIERLE